MKHASLPQEAIRIEDQWYVLATSSKASEPARVLKHGESFALFDRYGDTPRAGSGEHGLYHQGTRFLSLYELRLNGQRPMLLNSSVRRDNGVLTVDGTNPDIFEGGELVVGKGTVHLSSSWMLRRGACHERLEVANYGIVPVKLQLSLEFGADFADIFEVRGFQRTHRGRDLPPRVDGREVELGYQGLDEVVRRTQITFSEAPDILTAERADFELELAAHETFELDVRICCLPAQEPCETETFAQAYDLLERETSGHASRCATMHSPNEQFNEWIGRSASDLGMLCAGNPEGAYPYAGVPWYSVPFGRDGILTALQYLWVDPSMAAGVLRFLARTQAFQLKPEQDAEPGKIVHEMRKGELAALGEIPFGQYYGTIDATPLFVILAGEYYQRTGDEALIAEIWPHIERALEWIDGCGDEDSDGFVEYSRKSGTGLRNQGWKDSEDSVFHADGRLAEGPIALCEVQAYVYSAKVHAARLARLRGDQEHAHALEHDARQLHTRFERAFWMEDRGTYAIALDGNKRPCRVRTSNAGHVLWCGIASTEHAARVGETLLSAPSFSGWGVRTVAEGEPRYNPMSYHNGSIWPHDNALAAMGLARYGMKQASARITEALYEASMFMDLHRLPELFCGFPRRHAGEGPTLYPVACSPQAWASACPFYLMKACLGLSFRPEQPRVRFLHPVLPSFVDRLRLADLRAGDAVVDIEFERHGEDVGVNVIRKEGEVEVSVVL
ncbi:MAG TPA: amylo-alpha-1,6-glucosidase [Usitatibacter sp.]|nr:amylo-alpha-1,6-glucosidase [Usitatibacter sp.]